MKTLPVQKARLMDGAMPFRNGNINCTYRGQILLNDGSLRNAIIKDLDVRELGLELLVGAVGKLLGLPLPNSYLVVSDKTLPSAVGPILSGHRLMFASEDAKSPPIAVMMSAGALLRKRILLRLANSDSVYPLFSFDTWTANVDRHSGNLLWSAQGIWYIDHGRCLGGPTVAFDDLKVDEEYPQKITLDIAREMNDAQKDRVVKECGAFPNTASAVDATQLLSRNDIENILGAKDFGLAAQFLNLRRVSVPKLGAKLVGKELML